jgi:hypothetical protein
MDSAGQGKSLDAPYFSPLADSPKCFKMSPGQKPQRAVEEETHVHFLCPLDTLTLGSFFKGLSTDQSTGAYYHRERCSELGWGLIGCTCFTVASSYFVYSQMQSTPVWWKAILGFFGMWLGLVAIINAVLEIFFLREQVIDNLLNDSKSGDQLRISDSDRTSASGQKITYSIEPESWNQFLAETKQGRAYRFSVGYRIARNCLRFAVYGPLFSILAVLTLSFVGMAFSSGRTLSTTEALLVVIVMLLASGAARR